MLHQLEIGTLRRRIVNHKNHMSHTDHMDPRAVWWSLSSPASADSEVYVMGIVGFLRKFNTSRRIERFVKTFVGGQDR
jgi:hypothetical protein